MFGKICISTNIKLAFFFNLHSSYIILMTNSFTFKIISIKDILIN